MILVHNDSLIYKSESTLFTHLKNHEDTNASRPMCLPKPHLLEERLAELQAQIEHILYGNGKSQLIGSVSFGMV